MLNGDAIREIAALVASSATIAHDTLKTPDGVEFPVLLRSGGAGVAVLEDVFELAEKWRAEPVRREGTAKAFTLESLIDMTKRHADADSVVFAEIHTEKPRLTAVIDYNTIDHAPRFGHHRVVYEFPVSPEWAAWRKMDSQAFTQPDFASWIEDHIAELASPYDAERSQFEPLLQTVFATPADIVKLARGLQINVEGKIADIRNLQSGEAQIRFEETHKDGDGQPLKVPGLFMLSIPLFVGGVAVRVPCRLRYRRAGGSIAWSYHLYRPQEVMRLALADDVALVAKETGLPVYEGAQEA
jgi:uncharacterized protein YfdQ (DUF2303 family)